MWTPAPRGRMAEIEKKSKRYPTDLTDEEWARIQPFLPGLARCGRPVETDLREVLNAIGYLARSGGGWRMLPKDFPPWPTVYWWFRRFVRRRQACRWAPAKSCLRRSGQCSSSLRRGGRGRL